MERIMARQTFVCQPRHRSNNWLKPFRNLILYDGMEHRVHFEVGKLDTRDAVVRFSKLYSLPLVEGEPLRRIGRDFWVVVHHDVLFWRLYV
jgi:hypothetical protein